jgi:hypothetical protein
MANNKLKLLKYPRNEMFVETRIALIKIAVYIMMPWVFLELNSPAFSDLKK